MNNTKTLYIHIGTGKTGTSAIQKFLESNEDSLRQKHSLNYVKTGRSNAKHRSLDFNARRKLDGYVEVVCGLLKTTKSEIQDSECINHLISDEDFPGLSEQEIGMIRDVFHPDINIKIIVYLRRQDEYVESWFAQIVKTGAYTADINNLFDRLAAGSLLDYQAMLKPWEDILGADNILVKSYEPAQFKNGSLFDDFMSVMQIDTGGLSVPKSEVNTSLTRDKVLLLRKLARNGMVELIDKEFIEHLKTVTTNGDSKFVLSSERRQEIVSAYVASNNAVAKKYCQREELFTAPLPMEAENKWTPRSEVPDKLFLEILRYTNSGKLGTGSGK